MKRQNLSGTRCFAGSDCGGDQLSDQSVVNMKQYQTIFIFVSVEEQ